MPDRCGGGGGDARRDLSGFHSIEAPEPGFVSPTYKQEKKRPCAPVTLGCLSLSGRCAGRPSSSASEKAWPVRRVRPCLNRVVLSHYTRRDFWVASRRFAVPLRSCVPNATCLSGLSGSILPAKNMREKVLRSYGSVSHTGSLFRSTPLGGAVWTGTAQRSQTGSFTGL